TPCAESRNPMEKIPAVLLLFATGNLTEFHASDFPLTLASNRKRRGPPIPPVPKYTFISSGLRASAELLAAKALSPRGSASSPELLSRTQCRPPSLVLRITKRPFSGSPNRIPCCWFQKAIASQKPSGSWFVKTRRQ